MGQIKLFWHSHDPKVEKWFKKKKIKLEFLHVKWWLIRYCIDNDLKSWVLKMHILKSLIFFLNELFKIANPNKSIVVSFCKVYEGKFAIPLIFSIKKLCQQLG